MDYPANFEQAENSYYQHHDPYHSVCPECGTEDSLMETSTGATCFSCGESF